jgi:hypothetical protein
MESLTLVKCRHEACHCLVEKEQQFCCAACADAKKETGASCSCTHPGCHTTKKFVEEMADPLKVD